MGKFTRNKIAPEKNLVKRNSFFKNRKGNANKSLNFNSKNEDTPFTITKRQQKQIVGFGKNKKDIPKQSPLVPKVKSVKEDPFFMGGGSQSSQKESTNSRQNSYFNKGCTFIEKTNLKFGQNVPDQKASIDTTGNVEDKSQYGNTSKRRSLKDRVNTFTLRKQSNKEKDQTQRRTDKNTFTVRNSKFLTLSKPKSNSDFVASPASSGNFIIKEKTNESPSLDDNIEGRHYKPKKPFDKKLWRMQTYSKRYKVEQWEEKRKKVILRGYYKDIKGGDNKKFDVQKIYQQYESDSDDDENPCASNDHDENNHESMDVENENNLNTTIIKERKNRRNMAGDTVSPAKSNDECVPSSVAQPNNSKSKKNNAFKKAEMEYRRIKEEKQRRKEELAKKKQERDEALKIYKEKKVEKFKKLRRTTKKGQPIMNDRMEMLLGQIQKNIARK